MLIVVDFFQLRPRYRHAHAHIFVIFLDSSVLSAILFRIFVALFVRRPICVLLVLFTLTQINQIVVLTNKKRNANNAFVLLVL